MLVLLATRNKKLQQWSSMIITPNFKKPIIVPEIIEKQYFDRDNALKMSFLVPKESRLKIKIVFYKCSNEHQLKRNENDRACGMYGKQERCTQGFGGET
jgi:hypothetical protein